MKLREFTKKDYQFSISMISKINHSACEYFEHAYKTDKIIKFKVNDKGVVVFIEEEEFFICQVSFLDDVYDENIIESIENEINYISNFKKSLFLNMNNENQNIVKYFLNNNFIPDMFGIEFRFDKENYQKTNKDDSIMFAKLDESKMDEYIHLLDEAFNPIDAKKGIVNHFSKNKEQTTRDLILDNNYNNFKAMFYKGELIGMCILYENYIKDLVIKPIMQKKGFGKLLLNECLDILFNERGNNCVYLRTETTNENAINFYLSNGFQITGNFAETTYQLKK